jgi:hypothetical protein
MKRRVKISRPKNVKFSRLLTRCTGAPNSIYCARAFFTLCNYCLQSEPQKDQARSSRASPNSRQNLAPVDSIRTRTQYEALSMARAREQTTEYKALYHHRAGVEGTISQGTRAFGLRRSLYIGQAKTHLPHVITAAAMNFVRLANWLAGVPVAMTRQPSFARVMTQAVAT